MDIEFFILMSLFFAISLLITIIIVYFLSKINSLNHILDQAKEIDEAKIAKILRLESELESERKKSIDFSRRLQFVAKNEQRLKNALETVDGLQNELKEETDGHVEAMHRLKIDFNQLSTHYELLNKNYIQLAESHQKILDRNEKLIEENNQFHAKNFKAVEFYYNKHNNQLKQI
jgi:chromosome segregation ATPase